MNTKYSNHSNFIQPTTPPALDRLPVGVYEFVERPMSGIGLQKTQDSFILPVDHFNFDDWFIDRVIKTFENNHNKNLGILLSGLKGTGKTVTAKAICNKLNLPVILIKDMMDVASFINSITQDIIVFWDEFDKFDFSEENEEIVSFLTLMDGVYANNHKRLFILTANNGKLMPMLESRPSRIRYHKSYTRLELGAIEAIIDKNLINKSHKQKLIELLENVEDITFDIVKEIISEVNIFDSIDKIEEVFNYTKKINFWNAQVFDSQMELSNMMLKNRPGDLLRDIKNRIEKFGDVKKIRISLFDEYLYINLYGFGIAFDETTLTLKFEYIENGNEQNYGYVVFTKDDGVFSSYRMY